jgi:hypothetical protein
MGGPDVQLAFTGQLLRPDRIWLVPSKLDVDANDSYVAGTLGSHLEELESTLDTNAPAEDIVR